MNNHLSKEGSIKKKKKNRNINPNCHRKAVGGAQDLLLLFSFFLGSCMLSSFSD
jgi:hypothetical protein